MNFKNRFFLLLLMLHIGITVSAQNANILLTCSDQGYLPQPGPNGLEFTEPAIKQIFDNYQISDIKFSFVHALQFSHQNKDYLSRTVEFVCSDDPAGLLNDINAQLTGYFEYANIMEDAGLTGNPCDTDDPKDAPWNLTRHDIMCVREAWCITQGSPNVKIAIVDNGFDVTHDDIKNKIDYIEPGADNGACHGLHSAGAAAADTDNGFGLSSSGFNTRLLLYKLGSHSGSVDKLFDGFSRGARIANLSLCYRGPAQNPVQKAIDMLADLGMIIVASGGNGNFPGANGGGVTAYCYPASYDNVISIGAVTKHSCLESHESGCKARDGSLPAIGNYNDKIDFVAQGFGLDLLDCGNSFLIGCGTSFSGPQVAGVVGLILAVNPCLNHDDIMEILEQSETNIDDKCNNSDYYPNGAPGIPCAEQAVLLAQDFYKSYTITGIETWTDDREANEIIVEAGGHLIINSTVRFPTEGYVYVKRGGKLELNGAILTYGCFDDYWRGIYVEGNRILSQPSPFGMPSSFEAGVVLMQNSTIEKAVVGIRTAKYGAISDGAYWGGIIHAENSSFINNRKGVAFMKYEILNNSKFDNCTFEGGDDGYSGVSIWSTDGVTFNRNRFRSMSLFGVEAYDAGAIVVDGNDFEQIEEAAIRSYATHPFSSFLQVGEYGSEPNFFNENNIHVSAFAADQLDGINAINNEFFQGNLGVFIEGPSRYTIEKNSFFDQNVGVFLVNTDDQHNYIHFNNFQAITSGVDVNGDNKMLQVLSNCFDCTLQDQFLLAGRYRQFQGTSGEPASNCFTVPTDDIFTANFDQFFYFTPTAPTSPCLIPECNLSDGCITPNNYFTIPTSGIVKSCTGNPLGDGDPYANGDLNTIDNQIIVLEGQIANDPNNTQLQSDLYDLFKARENLVNYLVESFLENDDIPGAINLLSSESSTESQQVLLGLYLKEGMFTQASSHLASLPTTTTQELEFVQIQTINLARLQSDKMYGLNAQDEAFLLGVANSDSPMRAYAKSILALDGTHLPIELLNYPRGSRSQMEIERNIQRLVVLPNPSDGRILNLRVSNASVDENWQIQILAMDGRIILSDSFTGAEYKLNKRLVYSGVGVVHLRNDQGRTFSHRVVFTDIK